MRPDDIEACVHSYIRAWNGRDFEGMAAHFTEPAIFILDAATHVLPTRAALASFLREVFRGLEAAGFDHTEIGAIEVRRCASQLWLAEVADIRRFHRDGQLLGVLEVQYSFRVDATGAPKMISALWCDPAWRERVPS